MSDKQITQVLLETGVIHNWLVIKRSTVQVEVELKDYVYSIVKFYR